MPPAPRNGAGIGVDERSLRSGANRNPATSPGRRRETRRHGTPPRARWRIAPRRRFSASRGGVG